SGLAADNFKGQTGRVITVNCNGRALVTFDESKDRGRYDIEIDYLKVVDKPTAKPDEKSSDKPAAKAKQPEEETPQPVKLSPLEVARSRKEAEENGGGKADDKKAEYIKDDGAVSADS
ncbi:MAG: hypothetical protein U9N87_01010, partial [Planctomycetota bacterium]|nr:hypothetical protein [Planctomycetota bacterium]